MVFPRVCTVVFPSVCTVVFPRKTRVCTVVFPRVCTVQTLGIPVQTYEKHCGFS